jgi:hypothetical protein
MQQERSVSDADTQKAPVADTRSEDDLSWLYSDAPPSREDPERRRLIAKAFERYEGPLLKLSCGVLLYELDDASPGTPGTPAFVEITGRDPDGHLRVRIHALGAGGWPALSYAARLTTDGEVSWYQPSGRSGRKP